MGGNVRQNCNSALSLVCRFFPQVNKALFATYNFNAIFTLLTAQMLISVIVCTISRDYGGNPLNVPEFSWSLIQKALPIGVLYVCNVSVGLIAMKLVNLPMFFAIRKLVSPTLLAFEFAVFQKVPDQEVGVAVGLIGLGSLRWLALTMCYLSNHFSH